MKTCRKCGETKPLVDFHRSIHSKDGVRNMCAVCAIKQRRAYSLTPGGREAMKRANDRAHAKRKAGLKAGTIVITEDHKRRQREAFLRWVVKSPRQNLHAIWRHAIKRHPTDNPVTVDELVAMWRAQDGKCAVSGMTLTWKSGHITPTSISVDRIDSSRGYSKDNVRLVCHQVNTFKGRWDDEQMLTMAIAIVANAKPKLRLVS